MDGLRLSVPNVFIRIVAERDTSALPNAEGRRAEGSLGIASVFKEKGKPDYTYVPRDDGEYEQRLLNAISSNGTLTLLTGPSKTGKTTLYKQVFQKQKLTPVVIRCDNSQDDKQFWIRVAGAVTAAGGVTSAQTKKEIIPDPGSLSSAIKAKALTLVVEDFHYLRRSVQKTVFQQWKEFTDEEVSVLIVETRHHAVDLADANRELTGRTELIDVTIWNEDDLQQICKQGFACLNLEVDPFVAEVIASEAVGLPIVAQQCARQLLLNKNIHFRADPPRRVVFSLEEILAAFHDVAAHKYEHYAPVVKRLQQPRDHVSTTVTSSQLALAILTLDPPTFEYDYGELVNRLRASILPKAALPLDYRSKMIPRLKSVNRLPASLEIELLEWYAKDNVMHVLEPAFIFYLRWRKARPRIPTTSELFAEIFPGQMTRTRAGYEFNLMPR